MSLKLLVRKSSLPTCTSPYVVQSANSDLLEYESFVDLMASGRTALSKIEIIAAMELFMEELRKNLEMGATIKTPIGSFYLCASGTMDSPDDSFLPDDKDKNHELRVHYRPNPDFEASVRNSARIVRQQVVDQSSPVPQTITSSSAQEPSHAKLGDIVQIKGQRLKFDAKNPAEGVFFVDGTGAETRSDLYHMVQPRTIIASVPLNLAEGNYSVSIRTLLNGSSPRSGRLEGLTMEKT